MGLFILLPQFFTASADVGLEIFKQFILGLARGTVAPKAVAAAEDAFVGCGEVDLGIAAAEVIGVPIALEDLGSGAVFIAAEADDVINVGADEIVDLMTTVEVCMDGVFAAVRLYRPIYRYCGR